jgi:hypothetical protein
MTRKQRQQQDKKQNKIRVTKKRARLVEMFAKGLTVRQASKALKAEGWTRGSSRAMVGQDLQRLAREAPECIEEARLEARDQLRALNQAITSAKMMGLKDQVLLLLQIHDRYSRLLGLDAPTKQINANFTPTLPGLVAIDFSEGVEKTPNLVSEAEYMEEVEEAKLPFSEEMAKLEQP